MECTGPPLLLGLTSPGDAAAPSRPSLNLRRSARQRCQGDPVAQRFAMVKRMTKHPATQSGGIPKSIQIEELSALIHKSENTIRTCATNKKYQHLIPRPFKMPHSRRLCWWLDDVLAWIESNRPAEPPPQKRPRGRPTKVEQLARERWAQTSAARAPEEGRGQ